MPDEQMTREREVSPNLPNSGQILGSVLRSMGLSEPRLRDKTAQRYFSGRLDDLVKDSSRMEIFEAISKALSDMGIGLPTRTPNKYTTPSTVARVLEVYAVNWDRLRAILLPRMSRVYPSHLALVWNAYVRLSVVDLSLRVAAQLHLAGASPDLLDLLDWARISRPGIYLNELRSKAGLTLLSFSEVLKMSDTAVQAWLYSGARPTDENIVQIGDVLAPEGGIEERKRIVRELRQLYWICDLASTLGQYIGTESAREALGHLRRYASTLHSLLKDGSIIERDTEALSDLVTWGANSSFAEPLLSSLARHESDAEWREDILSASSDWIHRVLAVNLEVDLGEKNALIESTGGRILESWDVRNPKAYEHYQQSMRLQMEGRWDEAVAEVIKAAELDPLDPANHFTLGSAKGGIGVETGDEILIREGLNSCWLSVALDPKWSLPWIEIGKLLLGMGRATDAVEHLKAIPPDCVPLDHHYYTALGMALWVTGAFSESLTAYEVSLEQNPDDPRVAALASSAAGVVGDRRKSNRYSRKARHLGMPERVERLTSLAKSISAELWPKGFPENNAQSIAAYDQEIRRNPNNARAYFERAKAHFLEREDDKAISDLDAAIRLDPLNAGLHLCRGTVYGYAERHDLLIRDMSESIRLRPGEAIAYYYRGLSHGERDELDLAIIDLDEAIRLDPGHVDSYRARGDVHRYRDDPDLAIGDYDAALRLDPEHAASYRGRGAAYRMKGELDRAIKDYNSALQRNPVDHYAFRFRGDAQLVRAEYSQAISDFDESLRLKCRDEVAFRRRGDAHALRGEFDLALADYDAAVECGPESALATYGRGIMREAVGDAEGAKEDLRRAEELGYDEST